MEFEEWAHMDRDGFYLRRFSMSEHGGTHLTAPASYYPEGCTVDGYQAEDLVRPAVVIDAREKCRADRDYGLSTEDLRDWESQHGRVPSGSLVFLLTGWSEHWASPKAYLGADLTDQLHFPGFSFEATEFLVIKRAIAGLGTDTAGVEPGVNTTFSVSRLVLAKPRIVLENLANLDRLPPDGATVVIGVLKLEGGSGSPAAVNAFLPQEKI